MIKIRGEGKYNVTTIKDRRKVLYVWNYFRTNGYVDYKSK